MSSKKNTSNKSSEEKSKASAAFWDFLFMLEKLEFYGCDKHNEPRTGVEVYDGVEYVQRFGKPD